VNFTLGEYKAAISHSNRALQLQRQHLGPAHEDTLRTLHVLSEAHWWNGDDPKAMELAQEGLTLSRGALGDRNLVTLQFLADAAVTPILSEVGASEDIDRQLKEALRAITDVLGDTDKLTLRLKVALGARHVWQGRFHEAELILAEAIERQRSVLGENDPLMLEAMATLAAAYGNQMSFDRAETLNRRVLELRQRILGTDHALTVNIEIHQAWIYSQRGQAAEGEAIHRRLLELLAKGQLVETRWVVRSLVGLAGFYHMQEQWEKVEELAKAVLAAGERQFKEEQGAIAAITAMNDQFGRSLLVQNRYAEAEPHFRRTIEVREKFNNTHGRRYTAMNRLGYCLFKQNKDLGTAESLLKTSCEELERRSSQLPDYGRLEIIGGSLWRLAEFYDATAKPGEAAECRRKLAELERVEGRRLLRQDFAPPF
jgi:tetratricopeptide (TPR) repeat protein